MFVLSLLFPFQTAQDTGLGNGATHSEWVGLPTPVNIYHNQGDF